MDKSYNPQERDGLWQEFWDKQGLARPESLSKRHPKPSGKPFVICMPPPNVTGVLHQGHALTLSLEDTLIRWRRMCGDEALYLPGTDHASIAVQMQVSKSLHARGISYKEIGREAFLKEVWQWIETYQPQIYAQVKKLGTSCDWSRVRFTMDEQLNIAVVEAFVRFYNKGLIYRAERLVSWSPQGQTSLSDLEVIFEERDSFLWHIRYPIEGNSGEYLTLATTRPETMLGDTAVAVNPDDERYKKYIGKKVTVPIVGRSVPIIADAFVEKSFGTGVVKITPAHDPNDFECGNRHGLPRINIFTPDARIVSGLSNGAQDLAGLDRFEARKKIVQILEDKGLLAKIEPHKMRVGLSERWKDVVEPYLCPQWYMKMEGPSQKALNAVLSSEVEIVPKEFHNQFLRWMENIHDWCISRQLCWGQQIPAWHCQSCAHIEVAVKAPKNCSQCHGELKQDSDVFDTWFSSGLWPFSTLGWPDENASDYKKFYPGNVLETGFDILFFWVARMLMMGLELTGKAPFSKVYLHPMVRDEHGKKMSKTTGNVIDPLDIVNDCGADTLRFTLNILCVQGRDLNLSNERILGYRNFINKVWNASRFVLFGAGTEAKKITFDWRTRPLKPQALADRWILTRLDAVARDLNKAWSQFKMQEAAEELYHFIWGDYCDWYLEASKLSRGEFDATLYYVLGELLKLLHPLCPHVSEDIFHQMPGVEAKECLGFQQYPQGEMFPDTNALAEFQFIQQVISALRTLKAESKVPPGKKIKIYISSQQHEVSIRVLKDSSDLVVGLAKIEKIEWVPLDSHQAVTKVLVPSLHAGENVEIQVPLGELVNLAEEKERLNKEKENIFRLLQSQRSKLNNESFVSRAPQEVVLKEQLKLRELEDRLKKLEETLHEVNNVKV